MRGRVCCVAQGAIVATSRRCRNLPYMGGGGGSLGPLWNSILATGSSPTRTKMSVPYLPVNEEKFKKLPWQRYVQGNISNTFKNIVSATVNNLIGASILKTLITIYHNGYEPIQFVLILCLPCANSLCLHAVNYRPNCRKRNQTLRRTRRKTLPLP